MTRILSLLASLLGYFVSPVQAGQSSRVEIDIDPVVVLRCEDSISLDLGAADILQALEQPIVQQISVRALPSNGVIVASLGDVTQATRDKPVLSMPLERGCAVRGLSRGEGFVVDVRLGPEPILHGDVGIARIDVLRATGRMSDGIRAYTNRFTIPQSRVRLDTWVEIDFMLDLDISNAGTSGAYRSDSKGIFIVDVSTP